MDFERILLIVAGALLATLADWCTTIWRDAENRRAARAAEKILAEHGLSAYSYLPCAGVDDPVLHHALEQIAFSGRIVIDQKGGVIGKLIPKIKKGPHLRLVVDNSK